MEAVDLCTKLTYKVILLKQGNSTVLIYWVSFCGHDWKPVGFGLLFNTVNDGVASSFPKSTSS